MAVTQASAQAGSGSFSCHFEAKLVIFSLLSHVTMSGQHFKFNPIALSKRLPSFSFQFFFFFDGMFSFFL